MSITVRGADDVDALVRRMRQHADKQAIQRELYRGLNGVSKQVRAEMLEVIPDALPQRGGLAALVKSRTRARATAKTGTYAGVSLRFASSKTDVRVLTGKRLRHPVFGNRSVFVEQTEGVNPEVFPEAFDRQRDRVRDSITAVLEDIARKVAQ